MSKLTLVSRLWSVAFAGALLPAFEGARTEADPGVGRIVVRIDHFRNDRGIARVAVFDQPAGFPGTPEQALRRATSLERAADPSGAVFEVGVREQPPPASRHSRLRIVRPEHDPAHLRQHDRARALGTRLERDVQGAIGEAVGLEVAQGLLNRE